MKTILLVTLGCLAFGFNLSAQAAMKIINCPRLTLKNYGQPWYFDTKTQQKWQLDWAGKRSLLWNQVSIPQTTTCGGGKSHQGVPLRFQCAVLQCQSDAVTAVLGKDQPGVKCFSAYASTRNSFYCDNFSLN